MSVVIRLLTVVFILLSANLAEASRCGQCEKDKTCEPVCYKDKCCQSMGGVQYCDSSAGRLVCNNGFYSSCYCTRHAVMDLGHVQDCCTWQGGVREINDKGFVVCNNGMISEVCSATLGYQF